MRLVDRCDMGRDTDGTDMIQVITDIVPRHLPETQAVYLFGSAQDVLTKEEVPHHEGHGMNDAVINKAQSIQRCVKRAREEC